MIVGPHGLTALECCATVAIVAVRPVTALPGTGVIFKPVGVTTVGPLCPAIVTHEFGIIEPTAAVVVGNLIGVGIGTELAGAGVVMRACEIAPALEKFREPADAVNGALTIPLVSTGEDVRECVEVVEGETSYF
ncbi:unnamed protein product [Schistosoma mattheei]|uniref:Uncharacterized protein n=1 Tax=Schistosoma mattheei TaxID=31246 RepID=A0A183Q0M3_9TREM|nr:unnamed protein product [Schistosoma mattheei]